MRFSFCCRFPNLSALSTHVVPWQKRCHCRVGNLFATVSVAMFSASAMIATAQMNYQGQTKTSITFQRSLARLPLSFEVNQGQSDPQVKFMSRGSGYSLFITPSGAVLDLATKDTTRQKSRSPHAAQQFDSLRMELLGASKHSTITGLDRMPGLANYFIGHDSSSWRVGVPTYRRVEYSDVYPGIMLDYYGNQQQLEYDFTLAPKAKPQSIRMHFAGARSLKLDSSGNLIVTGKRGELSFLKPLIYQTLQDRGLATSTRKIVDGRFTLLAGNSVGFKVGSYDHALALVIDPALAYSTYLGGSSSDTATSIAVDEKGCAYVTGYTPSADFPVTKKAYQTANKAAPNGLTNAFVSKLSADGSSLVYSTYLGGSGVTDGNTVLGGDGGAGIAVDGQGNAYVAGGTFSLDFPTTGNAFQSTNHDNVNNAGTGFVSKLSADGSTLLYSTYLGGSGIPPYSDESASAGDGVTAIAVDATGNAYLTGFAYSLDFPVTAGAYQQENKAKIYFSDNAFVTKLNPSGSALVYSSYLGGSSLNPDGDGVNSAGDLGAGIAVDAAGNAYVAGQTFSRDFPTTADAFQKVNYNTPLEQNTAFVTKMNSSGSGLVYSTYLGGHAAIIAPPPPGYGDMANAIAVDLEGDAFVTGQTYSSDFPVTKGAFQSSDPEPNADYMGVGAAFVTKLAPSGSSLLYSTYLGGTGGDGGSGIAVDHDGRAFVIGNSYSTDFPVTANAFQKHKWENAEGIYINVSKSSVFMSELHPLGTSLLYSTYLGGSKLQDYASAIALDAGGNAYLAGNSFAGDFPVTPSAYQKTNPSFTRSSLGSNVFIAKFAPASSQKITQIALTSNANPQRMGKDILFTAHVTTAGGSGTPTGIIRFGIDGTEEASRTIDGTGSAVFGISSLNYGRHVVTAVYSGDPAFAPSDSGIAETVLSMPWVLRIVSGDNQQATYGTSFAAPLVFEVTDLDTVPYPDIGVTFSGTGLQFDPEGATTNANGEVQTMVRPMTTGSLTATAKIQGGTVVSAGANLVVSKAVLTVTASSLVVPYNQAIPALTYTVTGFVNGDKPSVLTGQFSETTTAKKGSAPGTYTISLGPGSAKASNYSFKAINGTITITSPNSR